MNTLLLVPLVFINGFEVYMFIMVTSGDLSIHFIHLFFRERERNISVWLLFVRPLLGPWTTTQECVLTRNRTSNTLVGRPALNPLSHSSQGSLCIHYEHLKLAKLQRGLRLLVWPRQGPW